MAGRVLRSSNGRFNGSTKGFRKGQGKPLAATATPKRQMSRKTKRRLIGLGVVAAAGVGAGIYVKKNGFSRALGSSSAYGSGVKGLKLGKATAYIVTKTKRMPSGTDTRDWRIKTKTFKLEKRDKFGIIDEMAGFKISKVIAPKGVKSRGHWRIG